MGRVPFTRSFGGFVKRKRKTFPRGKLFALDRPGLIDGLIVKKDSSAVGAKEIRVFPSDDECV